MDQLDAPGLEAMRTEMRSQERATIAIERQRLQKTFDAFPSVTDTGFPYDRTAFAKQKKIGARILLANEILANERERTASAEHRQNDRADKKKQAQQIEELQFEIEAIIGEIESLDDANASMFQSPATLNRKRYLRHKIIEMRSELFDLRLAEMTQNRESANASSVSEIPTPGTKTEQSGISSESRNVTIFAATSGNTRSPRHPVFLLDHSNENELHAGITAVPSLRNEFRKNGVAAEEASRLYARALAERIARRDPATLRALNLIARASLEHGAITIADNIRPQSPDARAVAQTITTALKKMGHSVEIRTTTPQQRKRHARDPTVVAR